MSCLFAWFIVERLRFLKGVVLVVAVVIAETPY